MAIQETATARSRLRAVVGRARRVLVRLQLADYRARQVRQAREEQAFEDRQEMTEARVFPPPHGH